MEEEGRAIRGWAGMRRERGVAIGGSLSSCDSVDGCGGGEDGGGVVVAIGYGRRERESERGVVVI